MVSGTVVELFIRSIITIAGLILTTFYFIESRHPKKIGYILVASYCSSCLIITFLFQYFIGYDTYLYWAPLITLLPSYFFFWIYGKDNLFKSQFNFCTQVFIMLTIIVISNILTNLILPNIWVDIAFRVFFYLLTTFFELKYLREPYRRYANEIESGWLYISFLAFFSVLALLFITTYPVRLDQRASYNYYAFFAQVILFLIVLLVVFYSFHNVYTSLKDKSEKDAIQLQIKALSVQLEQQNTKLDLTRVYRHDMRHHLETLLGLLQDERIDIVKAYIQDLSDKLNSTKVNRYCESPVMNSLLSYHFNKAKELGIEVKAKVTIPVDQMDIMDCTVLFANIVENALNACSKMSIDEQRFIDLKAISNGTSLSIQCSNTYSGIVRFDKYGFPKTSSKGHGIGSRSVSSIVDKYNGLIKYSTVKGVFTVKILINLLPKEN